MKTLLSATAACDLTMPLPRRQYDPVRSSDDDENESSAPLTGNESSAVEPATTSEKTTGGETIQITILDYMQKRFSVEISPFATVRDLKDGGACIHKVPVDRQRLIFHGRLLRDEECLHDVGINQNEIIVHLFPKPRVVIKNSQDDEAAEPNAGAEADPDASSSSEGANIPTIVLDENEAQQRSTILVLGSQDYLEAQNNVKLFSFMLLIISSIELLSLLSIAMGVPQEGSGYYDYGTNGGCDSADDLWPCDPSDDAPGGNSTASGDAEPRYAGVSYQQWGVLHYFDLMLSLAGVYVSLMGLKAANHNALMLARRYLYGTFIVGVYWILFNYFLTFRDEKRMYEKLEEQQEQQDPEGIHDDMPSDGDLLSQAMSVMVLPSMIWGICCLRAWQFHHLLHEAEAEAEERIRAQASGDEELALQNESAELA